MMNIYDVHCHPTDSPASLEYIPSMVTTKLVVMSTCLKDMPCVESLYKQYPEKVVPAFGFHPWYSYQIYNDLDSNETCIGNFQPPNKFDHYKTVISPQPSDEFLNLLPSPFPLSTVISEIESRLARIPQAIVGECGLDKIFRIPEPDSILHDEKECEVALENRKLSKYRVSFDHQNMVLKAQLHLAVKYNRPISLHGVQCPGALYQTVMEGPKFPPSVCLHSYTGSAEFLKNNWYKSKSKKKTPETHQQAPKIYVSCSILINEKSHDELIKTIPRDRLLFESDFHKAGDYMDKLNLAILEKASKILGVSIEDLAAQVEQNVCKGFLFF
ncbi:uncharacterized protein SAPINGB_P004583 [Magnusiomyces paraingens]|uniref:Uncharacterized protein n=1 Tax=Magnusiomyces paraingens TaxID=2606893 RepID=A0A5E8BWC6_9ASCO|nr:uncharacterized protein SAPINGB_P004583 [Saprochaete ingens]VVT55411.1 unnamed protein product [Saprochaete ingens]